ncbi:MAG: N-acetyltransferase [Chloroflexi bacterium]|nr:N-acetyltransferase [Chloroflexota bacterium]
MVIREAEIRDCEAIARIYNEGIAERIATFETQPRAPEDIAGWFDGVHPVVVADENGEVLAFASTSTYRPRACYAGIAEFSVYVSRKARGRGLGKRVLQGLITAAQEAGFWKLISRIFPENTASLGLMKSMGFREVGLYKKHGKLDGEWRDVVIVEYLIEANAS